MSSSASEDATRLDVGFAEADHRLGDRDVVVVTNREPYSHEHDGVLVLSETAGVTEEIADSAALVNPIETDSFADRIKQAAEMSPDRRRRMRALDAAIRGTDGADWVRELFRSVASRSEGLASEVNTRATSGGQ